MPAYQELVSQLRTAFPAPVSDRVHDAYFVFSFLRALDQVDSLKSAAPMLGKPMALDYDAARLERIADEPTTLEAVTAQLVRYLSGMFIWGHPRPNQRGAYHRRFPASSAACCRPFTTRTSSAKSRHARCRSPKSKRPP